MSGTRWVLVLVVLLFNRTVVWQGAEQICNTRNISICDLYGAISRCAYKSARKTPKNALWKLAWAIKECFMRNAEQTRINGNKIRKGEREGLNIFHYIVMLISWAWHGSVCYTCEAMPSREVAPPAGAPYRRILLMQFHRAPSHSQHRGIKQFQRRVRTKKGHGEVPLQSFLSKSQKVIIKKTLFIMKT